jgi:hypothetical protein
MTAIPTPPAGPGRRRHLCEPGEPLSPGTSPIGSLVRFGLCLEDWGVSPASVMVTPICTVPLTTLPAKWAAEEERWAGVRPEALWHPLLWLPQAAVNRRWVPVGELDVAEESDDIWALRLCYELIATGLYDEDSGTWFDVLAGVGLDAESPDDTERLARWLGGDGDPVLDGIDLTEMFLDSDSPDLASDAARENLAELWHYTWALGSSALLDDLGNMCADILAPTDGRDPAGAVADLSLVATVGKEWFSNLPAEMSATGDEAAWWDAFAREVQAFSGARRTFVEQIVGSVAAHLGAIREATWPWVDRRMAEASAEPEALVAETGR